MKLLTGIFSLVIGAGVAGAPIAVYSIQNNQRLKSSLSSDRSGSSAPPGEAIRTRAFQLISSFDETGQRVEQDYKSRNILQNGLRGENNLESIFIVQKSMSSNGGLKRSVGRPCDRPTNTMETFCGFLHLNQDNIEYKLKIAVDNDGKGKIKIVKKVPQKVEYYDHYHKSGINSTNENFDQLSDFSQDTNDSWKAYQDAIIHPLQK